MTELDKTKPFSTIHGRTSDGARYVQGGVRFKANGLPCRTERPVPEPQKEVKPAKPTQSKKPAAKNDDEARGMAQSMAEDGKTVMEIAKFLGIHHMKVRALLK